MTSIALLGLLAFHSGAALLMLGHGAVRLRRPGRIGGN
jgi:hypothetical protein